LLEVLEHAFGADGIEGRVGKWQRVDARHPEVDGLVRRVRRAPRGRDHRFRRVDSGDLAARTDAQGELDTDFAGAAPDVEHRGAGLQPQHLVAFAASAGQTVRKHREVVDKVLRARAAVDVRKSRGLSHGSK